MSSLKRHFNSQTLRGRANVAKATYASLTLLYIFYRLRKGGKKGAGPENSDPIDLTEQARTSVSTKYPELCKCQDVIYAANEEQNETLVAKAVAATEPRAKGIVAAATRMMTDDVSAAHDTPGQLKAYAINNDDDQQQVIIEGSEGHVTDDTNDDEDADTAGEGEADEEHSIFRHMLERFQLNPWDL